MSFADNSLLELEKYLLFMKMSGVKYLPRAVHSTPSIEIEAETMCFKNKTHLAISNTPEFQGSLQDIRRDIEDCTRCALNKTRTNIVFGYGSPNADLLLLGPSPAHEDDISGRPFMDEAGELLTKIIEAINLRREDVYLSNIIKCKTVDNARPGSHEIEECKTYLARQIKAINPKVICTLGEIATQSLLNTETSISILRGEFHDYKGIPVMPTYHPSYILKHPEFKRDVWHDIKLIKKALDNDQAKN